MGKQKNIIIIEDDETFSLLITHYLKNNLPGVNVFVENSGEKAIKSLSRLKPSLVVLDYYLENDFSAKNVMEKLWELKQKPYVILLSSITDEEEKAEVMKMGVDSFIPKANESIYDLVKAIRNAIDTENSERALSHIDGVVRWPILILALLIALALIFGVVRSIL